MKKVAVLAGCVGVLMLASSIQLFMQARSDGDMIFLSSGIGFEPKDLALALRMLVMMLAVLLAAAWHDAKKATRWLRLASIAALLVPLVFAVPFEARRCPG